MKVQIEIPTKAVNMAIARISRSASNDNDLNALEQAVSRCNEETTEIDLDLSDDEDLFVPMMLAMVAIVKRGEEIEKVLSD